MSAGSMVSRGSTYGQIVSAVATISMIFFPSISGKVPGV